MPRCFFAVLLSSSSVIPRTVNEACLPQHLPFWEKQRKEKEAWSSSTSSSRASTMRQTFGGLWRRFVYIRPLWFVAHPILQPVIPIQPDWDGEVPLGCDMKINTSDFEECAMTARLSTGAFQEMIGLVPRTKSGFATKEMMLRMFLTLHHRLTSHNWVITWWVLIISGGTRAAKNFWSTKIDLNALRSGGGFRKAQLF